MNDEIKLSTLSIKDDDIILMRFNLNDCDLNEINQYHKNICNQFPNNKVLSIPNFISMIEFFSIEDLEKTQEMVNQYFEEIKKEKKKE